MNSKVAVIMSIYKSDIYEYVKESILSILNQSYNSVDLYIQVDGDINNNVKDLLDEYSFKSNVYIFFNKLNLGLAKRLNDSIDIIVNKGGYDFVARMDADDISCYHRIDEQVKFLLSNPDVDVVGSDIIEINEDGEDIFYKKMDSNIDIIKSNIVKKCPLNHPSVMFRTNLFYEGFRYKSHLMNTQDYYLWVDLLADGKIISNINKPLLKFRVNKSFHSRRGFKKAINDVKSRLYALNKLDVNNISNIVHIFSLFILRISPSSVKKIAYKYLR